MTTKSNKTLVRRYFDDVWNARDLAATDDLFAADFRDPTAPPRIPPGPAGARDFVAENVARLPDIQYTVHDLIAEGDIVVATWTARGTNDGPLRTRGASPRPPTGKTIEWTGATVFRLRDGRIIEARIYQDRLGIFKELGLATEVA